MLTGWRQAAAPMLVLAIAYATVRAVLGQPAHVVVPSAYALGLMVAAFLTLDRWAGEGEGEPPPVALMTRLTVAAAWGVMHTCRGAGFLFGLGKFW
jgi:hypothetical protein